MTLGLVSARYAFALRASPALPWTREEVSGVSVVLTWQSLCFCLAVYLIGVPGHAVRTDPSSAADGAVMCALEPALPAGGLPISYRGPASIAGIGV